jgi:hypothetical protein
MTFPYKFTDFTHPEKNRHINQNDKFLPKEHHFVVIIKKILCMTRWNLHEAVNWSVHLSKLISIRHWIKTDENDEWQQWELIFQQKLFVFIVPIIVGFQDF